MYWVQTPLLLLRTGRGCISQPMLKNDQCEEDKEVLFKNITHTSSKFIKYWLRNKLIIGLCHDTNKEVISNIEDYNDWVNDFRGI